MAPSISRYLHTVTGVVEDLDDDLASAFPDFLKKVDAEAKSFVVGMFKPGTVSDFDASYRKKEFTTTDDPAESTAPGAAAVIDPPAVTETPAPAGGDGASEPAPTPTTSEGN